MESEWNTGLPDVSDPTAKLQMRPKKSILKNISFEVAQCSNEDTFNVTGRESHSPEATVMKTLHPPDKDYGHMKIDEPKTPYNYSGGEDEDWEVSSERIRKVSLTEGPRGLSASELCEKLASGTMPNSCKRLPIGLEDDEETVEQQEKRKAFEVKRKQHYNEGKNLKLAKMLLKEDEEKLAQEAESCTPEES